MFIPFIRDKLNTLLQHALITFNNKFSSFWHFCSQIIQTRKQKENKTTTTKKTFCSSLSRINIKWIEKLPPKNLLNDKRLLINERVNQVTLDIVCLFKEFIIHFESETIKTTWGDWNRGLKGDERGLID